MSPTIITSLFFVTSFIYICSWCFFNIPIFHLLKVVPVLLLYIAQPTNFCLFLAMLGDVCLMHPEAFPSLHIPQLYKDNFFNLGLIVFGIFQCSLWYRFIEVSSPFKFPFYRTDQMTSFTTPLKISLSSSFQRLKYRILTFHKLIKLYLLVISFGTTVWLKPSELHVAIGVFLYTSVLLHSTRVSILISLLVKNKKTALQSLGMILFCISDFVLAYNRFKAPVNFECWFVISTYWFAMFLLFTTKF